MKKIVSMLLVLMMVLPLGACGSKHPLSQNYETADELAAVLRENYNREEKEAFLTALKENTGIHHFFSEAEKDNRLWEKLIDEEQENHLDLSVAYDIYAACNDDSRWFDALNIGGRPFEVYSSRFHTKFPRSRIVEKIKDKFIDPESVSIIENLNVFTSALEREDSPLFPTPLRYRIVVTVRATNAFGGYVTQGYLLEENKYNGYDIITECEPKYEMGYSLARSGYLDGYCPNDIIIKDNGYVFDPYSQY